MSPRIGVVGLGNMGSEHATRIEDAGGDIVGGADIVPEARTQFGQRFGAEIHEDWNDLYASDVDAVVITLPNVLHEPAAVDALEAGLDVLLEKPLAHTLESAERIADVAQSADGFCMTGFVMRFYPVVEELCRHATDGSFGEISHVEATYVRRNQVPASGWFIDPELAGGGALVDVGVHVLDLALAVTGFPPIDGVYGRTRNECTSLDVEDSASALLGSDDGPTISLEVAWAANTPPDRSILVRGNEGGAHLDLSDLSLAVYDDPETGGEDPVPVETPDHDWLAPEDEAFVTAVDEERAPSRGTLDEALTVQRAIDAVYQSSTTGGFVDPSAND